MKYEKLTVYTDGGSRGNPGPSGIGAIIYDENKNKIAEISEYIGEGTNNQAEYKAVIAALEKCQKLGGEFIEFYLDSELVVEQLNRHYKVKERELANLFLLVHNRSLSFKKLKYKHIPREMNKEADKLVNLALDKAGK
jgi:ribonuclease HI